MLDNKYREQLDNISNLNHQYWFKYVQSLKAEEKIQNHSHGCLIDFPDWLSAIKPINQTKIKAKEVKPKKISA